SHSPLFFFSFSPHHLVLHSFPTRRSSDLIRNKTIVQSLAVIFLQVPGCIIRSVQESESVLSTTARDLRSDIRIDDRARIHNVERSEEHTSELQSRGHLVCRLLLEKKKMRL